MYIFFFFNDTATTEIYTLSLHDALPISGMLLTPNLLPIDTIPTRAAGPMGPSPSGLGMVPGPHGFLTPRSEEHTSELQSRLHLVCRLLLEKKKDTHALRTNYATSRSLRF